MIGFDTKNKNNGTRVLGFESGVPLFFAVTVGDFCKWRS